MAMRGLFMMRRLFAGGKKKKKKKDEEKEEGSKPEEKPLTKLPAQALKKVHKKIKGDQTSQMDEAFSIVGKHKHKLKWEE
ncbi:hypothetical protein ACFLQ2_03260 [archaeon]